MFDEVGRQGRKNESKSALKIIFVGVLFFSLLITTQVSVMDTGGPTYILGVTTHPVWG